MNLREFLQNLGVDVPEDVSISEESLEMNVIIQVPADVASDGFQPDEVYFDYNDNTVYVRATY